MKILEVFKKNMMLIVAAVIATVTLMSFVAEGSFKDVQQQYWFAVDNEEIGEHLPNSESTCPDPIGDLCAIALNEEDVDLSDPNNPQPKEGVDISDENGMRYKPTAQ